MSDELLIVGAGGHARVIANLVSYGDWRVRGVLGKSHEDIGESVGIYRVVGTLEDLQNYYTDGVRFAAIAIGDNALRATVFAQARNLGFEVVSLVHPRAFIESNAQLGAGVTICIGAVVGAEVTIGDDVIVNSGAIVDHECWIGDHAHLAPGVRIAGRVRVGPLAFIGIGTCVRERMTIGESAIIGAGSVVVASIPDHSTAFGCPARVRR